jgi:hypothetical protein
MYIQKYNPHTRIFNMETQIGENHKIIFFIKSFTHQTTITMLVGTNLQEISIPLTRNQLSAPCRHQPTTAKFTGTQL